MVGHHIILDIILLDVYIGIKLNKRKHLKQGKCIPTRAPCRNLATVLNFGYLGTYYLTFIFVKNLLFVTQKWFPYLWKSFVAGFSKRFSFKLTNLTPHPYFHTKLFETVYNVFRKWKHNTRHEIQVFVQLEKTNPKISLRLNCCLLKIFNNHKFSVGDIRTWRK